MEKVKIKMHTIEVCKYTYDFQTEEWSDYETPWRMVVAAHEEEEFLIEEIRTELYEVHFSLVEEGFIYLWIDEKERQKLLAFWRNMLTFDEFEAEAKEWLQYYESIGEIKYGCDFATIS